MLTSAAKTADELMIEMADVFIPALDEAKDHYNEDSDRMSAMRSRELMEVWRELHALASMGEIERNRLLD